LAKEQYVKRQDRVCVQLHFNICKKIGVTLDNEQRYDIVSTEISRNRSRR